MSLNDLAANIRILRSALREKYRTLNIEGNENIDRLIALRAIFR